MSKSFTKGMLQRDMNDVVNTGLWSLVMELVKQHNPEGSAGDRSDQLKAAMAYLTCIGSPVLGKRGRTWTGSTWSMMYSGIIIDWTWHLDVRACTEINNAQASNLVAASHTVLDEYFKLDLQGVHGKSSLPMFVYHYKDGAKTGLMVTPIGDFVFPRKRFLLGAYISHLFAGFSGFIANLVRVCACRQL